MDESRKQFEEWFKPKKLAMMNKGMSMLSIRKVHSLQWEAWKASRQAIEIDLSDCFSPYDCGDEAVWIDQLQKQLSRLGLKIEEAL